MFTREHLEHELLKVKAQVSPTHRCPTGGRYFIEGVGPCLLGRVFENLGADWEAFRVLHIQPQRVLELRHASLDNLRSECNLIVTKNDTGHTWHSIIDEVLAMPHEEAPAGAVEVAQELVEA